jgi:hypothetical protein
LLAMPSQLPPPASWGSGPASPFNPSLSASKTKQNLLECTRIPRRRLGDQQDPAAQRCLNPATLFERLGIRRTIACSISRGISIALGFLRWGLNR